MNNQGFTIILHVLNHFCGVVAGYKTIFSIISASGKYFP